MTPEADLPASQILTPEGVIAGSVSMTGDQIVQVAVGDLSPRNDSPTVDLADDEVLLPGLVDTHVHVNEPGRTDWEGFPSAARRRGGGRSHHADEEWVVNLAALHHRRHVSPYANRTLTETVRASYFRGREIDRSQPSGRLLDANHPS